jgi:hypothetical protein
MSRVTLTTVAVPTDSEITEALALICSPVFGALNIANAFAGAQTTPWRLIRETEPLSLLFREALDRKIDLSSVNCAVEGGKIVDTKRFKHYMQQAENLKTEDEG